MKRLACSLALLLVSNGPALAESAAEGIEAGNDAFDAAFNGGDGAAVAALHGDDAAIFPPEAPRMDGREAIAAFWQGAIDAGLSDLDLQTVEVVESGDQAVEVGAVTLNVPGSDGATVTAVGKYVVVWQRGDDGAWRLHRDIWNLDPPAE